MSATTTFECLSTTSLKVGFESLSVEQKYSFAKFTQGQNLFVTGPGGTGKTRLIQFLVEYMNSTGKSHQVCALTGCAATLLNCKAKTIHSWSGVRLAKGVSADIVNRVIRNRNITKSWRSTEVLIVDEVSMMSSKMFDLLDQIGRATRKCNGKPFGGIQLIFTGDFFQLPPIPDQGEPGSGEFCFQHPKWAATFKAANCIELQTFFRQTDPAYISILQEVRRGTISPANSDLLRTRLMRGRPSDKGDGIVPTKLFPVRAKVDTINESSYERLEGEERVYHFSVTTKAKTHIDTGTVLSAEETAHCEELTSEQLSREVDTLITSLFTEKTVRLKIGTLVMCTANIDVDRGICNGSQGIVIGYADLVPSAVLPDELLRGGGKPISVPLVRFSNGVTMKVAPHQRQSEEFPCIIVAQIPLCLAWALTIHKIQGATLDMAEMDIGRSIFADGQSYVALSRVKTLEGLNLSEFNATKIKANPLVVEFYDSFPKIGEDEMLSEIGAILSKFAAPVQPTILKQASMQSFAVTKDTTKKDTTQKETNPFSAFAEKDPTIKTVILSKY